MAAVGHNVHGLETVQALFLGRLAHRRMDSCEDVQEEPRLSKRWGGM